MEILITGAAGNVGTQLTKYLLDNSNHTLRLLVHKKPLQFDYTKYDKVKVFYGDMTQIEGLYKICQGCNCIVHLAGKLFAPRPEKFLYTTNFLFAKNIIDASIAEHVKKFILISFPQVEGETTPEQPAREK